MNEIREAVELARGASQSFPLAYTNAIETLVTFAERIAFLEDACETVGITKGCIVLIPKDDKRWWRYDVSICVLNNLDDACRSVAEQTGRECP